MCRRCRNWRLATLAGRGDVPLRSRLGSLGYLSTSRDGRLPPARRGESGPSLSLLPRATRMYLEMSKVGSIKLSLMALLPSCCSVVGGVERVARRVGRLRRRDRPLARATSVPRHRRSRWHRRTHGCRAIADRPSRGTSRAWPRGGVGGLAPSPNTPGRRKSYDRRTRNRRRATATSCLRQRSARAEEPVHGGAFPA